MGLLKDGNIDKKCGFCIFGFLLLLIVALYSFSFVPVHYVCIIEGDCLGYYGVTKNIDLFFETKKVYGPTTVVYGSGDISIDKWKEATLDDSCRLIY